MTKLTDLIPRKKMGEGGYMPSNITVGKGFNMVDGVIDLTKSISPQTHLTSEELTEISPSMAPAPIIAPKPEVEVEEEGAYLKAHPELKLPSEYRTKKEEDVKDN